MKKKLIAACLSLALMGGAVMGTLAWLTDREEVVNTFTVGNVDITVDEKDVDENGVPIPNADRVKENDYHLIPGQTYVKDPTMTVKANSEESYVRMLLTINCKSALDAIFAPDGVDMTTIFGGYDETKWIFEAQSVSGDTVTYEFRYCETVDPDNEDVTLEPLFETLIVPGELTGEDLASIKDLKITVVGHAIQTIGFTDEDAAWEAFDKQYES